MQLPGDAEGLRPLEQLPQLQDNPLYGVLDLEEPGLQEPAAAPPQAARIPHTATAGAFACTWDGMAGTSGLTLIPEAAFQRESFRNYAKQLMAACLQASVGAAGNSTRRCCTST